MGRMVDGRWTTEWYGHDRQGRFQREPTKFRGSVTADGSSGFRAEPGRYHIYASLACPWAHRTLIARKLKRLEDAISISIVHPHMGEQGWQFAEAAGTIPDTVNGARFLHEIYTAADPSYTGRVTVPVLWDKQTATIVCNESRLILRMLDHEMNAWADAGVDFCPRDLQAAIDAEIDAMYDPVNNGVYRAGFARTQGAYEEAAGALFEALDRYDERLRTRRFLFGPSLTEADICLFTTLLRFDPVYHYHFKCNLRRVRDYPNLGPYVRDIYQIPGVAMVCDMFHIKQHYYTSHPQLNPSGIVPQGPPIDLTAPHDRQRLG